MSQTFFHSAEEEFEEGAQTSGFNLPEALRKKLVLRENKRNHEWYNSEPEVNNVPSSDYNVSKFVKELIDCLNIAKKRDLSPVVQSDLIALIIRSYLAQDRISIAFRQPLKLLFHSSFHSYGFLIVPPKKSDSNAILSVNSSFQWRPLDYFQIQEYIGKVWHVALIGSTRYQTLIFSTPEASKSVLYAQSGTGAVKVNQIQHEIIHLWKQNNQCFALTRKRSSRESQLTLFNISVSLTDGSIQTKVVFDQKLRLFGRTDYRISGAYFHDSEQESEFFKTALIAGTDNDSWQETESKDNTSVKQNASSKITVQHGFPAQNFLLLIGEINLILVKRAPQLEDNDQPVWKQYNLNPDWQLQSFFYHPFSETFLGITRSLKLVEIKLSFNDKSLVISKEYKQVLSNGLTHYFYDSDTDMIVVYRFLGTCTKYRNQLVMLPVASYLMKEDSQCI